jgi:hypothetical protein
MAAKSTLQQYASSRSLSISDKASAHFVDAHRSILLSRMEDEEERAADATQPQTAPLQGAARPDTLQEQSMDSGAGRGNSKESGGTGDTMDSTSHSNVSFAAHDLSTHHGEQGQLEKESSGEKTDDPTSHVVD